jgi:hypothetical protein
MAQRCTYLVSVHNSELVVNTDQAGINFVPTGGSGIKEMKDTKHIKIYGQDDK